jgi:hypothetical protein
MKFRKFGKALLMSALSAGVALSVTSCVQSYSVGYLYVTGTQTSGSNANANGIISGFKIDHNTGNLTAIHGLPVASGGANPVRAVLLAGSRFLYVLNRGVNSSNESDCTTATPCQASITQFAVGGNGVLSQQPETFYPQGSNSSRLIADSSGSFLYVLDHDSPSAAACALALGSTVTSCGDITAFKVDTSTGRLTLLVNAQVTSASGAALPYFPVPSEPIDFTLASGYLLTLSGTPGATANAGDSVFPYTYSSSTGQLTVNQNSSQPVSAGAGTALVYGGGYLYLLDNEPITITSGTSFAAGTYLGQILPFTIGTNGALQAQTGGAVPTDTAQTNPIYLVVESKGKWVYVANQGNNASTTNTQSGIVGYVLDPSTHQLDFMSGSPFGSGAGPQCMLEDPSDQFIYTANFNDSTVTGRVIDQNSGVLNNLPGKANKSFTLNGPATWCVVSGRTS